MLCFTLLGARIDHSINTGGPPYMFKMNGVVGHLIGSLFPSEDTTQKFAHLYMVDSADEIRSRINVFDNEESDFLGPDPEIVSALTQILNTYHRLFHKFRIARQNLCTPAISKVSIYFLGEDGGAHGTCFLVPQFQSLQRL